MRRVATVVVAAGVLFGLGSIAAAATCPGHPDAIGTSRTIVVDPTEHARIGTMQYHETLPLKDKEVVLTFDDGPLPPHTTRVLDILAAQCVKATFFIVGRMARDFPHLVQREFAEGHTIGTHSQNHPLHLDRKPLAFVAQEVQQGIAATAKALGDKADLSPFFRVPGLNRNAAIDHYLASQGLMTWSADFPADDWTHISANEIMRRALSRLEAKGKGVLLLHDIQPATVRALPALLHQLKVRGYRIVHVVAATPDRPKTVTAPEDWLMHRPHEKPVVVAVRWPKAPKAVIAKAPQLAVPDPASFGLTGPVPEAALLPDPGREVQLAGPVPLPPLPLWPRHEPPFDLAPSSLPVPDVAALGLPRHAAARGTLPPLRYLLHTTAAGTPEMTPAVVTRRHRRKAASHPPPRPSRIH